VLIKVDSYCTCATESVPNKVTHKEQVVPLSVEACLPAVEEALRYVARRYRLADTELDDLRSEVHVRLIERDGLAAFQQRSSLRTYLVTAVHHALLDLRDKRWQRWRPSVEAKRLGPLAIKLEELLVRDGYAFGEACHLLRTNCGVSESEAQLAALRDRLPSRIRRRLVGEEAVREIPASESADGIVMETEQRFEATRLGAALEQSLMALDSEDRLVLKMRFYDGLKVSEIARLLQRDQKALYRVIEGLLVRLRAALSARGFANSELMDVLGEAPIEFPPVFGPPSEHSDTGSP
jgi:RNA polymerase sigma factor (sigma-70 family)